MAVVITEYTVKGAVNGVPVQADVAVPAGILPVEQTALFEQALVDASVEHLARPALIAI